MISKLGATPLQGIHRSTQGMVRSASDIARSTKPGDPSNLTRAMVELKHHEHATKANMKTLATADRVLGSLLDVKA